jgi:taurine dioxygenase
MARSGELFVGIVHPVLESGRTPEFPMTDSEIDLRPISGTLGAEVSGIDCRRIDDATFEQIHAALLEYQVLFFRETKLSDDQHIALAERWGNISVFPLMKVMGSTEGSFQVIQDGPDSPPAADNWHTDVTWTPQPPKVALLRATLVPERGGDTMWGSMTAAGWCAHASSSHASTVAGAGSPATS